MPSLSLDTVLARNERLSWRVLSGEAVILFPDVGSVHRLNDTGTAVWQRLDGSSTLADIAGALTRHYEVAVDQANDDIRGVAGELVDAGLAQVVT